MGTQPKWVQTPEGWLVYKFRNGVSISSSSRTQHDEPLRLSGTGAVLLGVSERRNVDLVGLVDLVLGSVSDEDGLASPLDDNLKNRSAMSS
jgi:hypothetical protein